jgi:hypothetical protein
MSKITQARRSLSCHVLRTAGRTVVHRSRRLTISFEHVLQDCPIQRQVSDDPLELGVLIAQLPQLANLWGAELPKALLPDVEGGFGNAEFADDLSDRCSEFRLPQGGHDLLVGVRDLRTGEPLILGGSSPSFSGYPWSKISGEDSMLGRRRTVDALNRSLVEVDSGGWRGSVVGVTRTGGRAGFAATCVVALLVRLIICWIWTAGHRRVTPNESERMDADGPWWKTECLQFIALPMATWSRNELGDWGRRFKSCLPEQLKPGFHRRLSQEHDARNDRDAHSPHVPLVGNSAAPRSKTPDANDDRSRPRAFPFGNCARAWN